MAKLNMGRIVREIDPTSNMKGLADALSSVLGSDAVHKASDSDQGEPRMFIPSGVPDLDLVLDREGRGWPVGRIVEVFGAEATCKTGIGYALIASAQKLGGDAILYPAEGNWDEWLAIQYGIDLSKIVIGDDETVEGIFGSYRKALQVTGKSGLLIGMIDSIAAMATRAELKDLDDGGEFKRDRSAQVRALMISSALRKMGALIPRTNAILFCVNQIRDNPDAMFGDKTKPPGGKALKFYASIRLKLTMIGQLKRTKKGKSYTAGFKLRVTAIKNRMALPYQSADIILDFQRGLLPMPKKKAKRG